jgi:tetratricopeptide (TPR) repeat protein
MDSAIPKGWRLVAVIGSGLLATAVFVWLAIRADQNQAKALDAALLSFIGLVFSVIASVLVGKWSAHDSTTTAMAPFLRSAFRSHVGLQQGLRRLRLQIERTVEGISGTDGVVGIRVRDLLQVIDELEARADDGLENWRELRPTDVEEFEKQEVEIQTDMRKLSAAVSDLRGAAGQGEPDAVSDRVRGLEDSIARLASGTVKGGDARRLMVQGAYEEAIALYTQLIAVNPKAGTLYLARARARHLAGDRTGAIEDARTVKTLQPEDAVVSAMADQIERGVGLVAIAPAGPSRLGTADAGEGNTLLSRGLGEQALKCYDQAAAAGLRAVYSKTNRAMAFTVAKKFDEALRELDAPEFVAPGPYVRIHRAGLRALILALRGSDNAADIKELREAVTAVDRYEFGQGPLRFLEVGLYAVGLLPNSQCDDVMALLKNPPSRLVAGSAGGNAAATGQSQLLLAPPSTTPLPPPAPPT